MTQETILLIEAPKTLLLLAEFSEAMEMDFELTPQKRERYARQLHFMADIHGEIEGTTGETATSFLDLWLDSERREAGILPKYDPFSAILVPELLNPLE